jgi:hypothetical protein
MGYGSACDSWFILWEFLGSGIYLESWHNPSKKRCTALKNMNIDIMINLMELFHKFFIRRSEVHAVHYQYLAPACEIGGTGSILFSGKIQ